MRAAGTNPIDYKLYSGQMGDDPDALPMPVGMEAAGVVARQPAAEPGLHRPAAVGRRGDRHQHPAAATPTDVIADAAEVGHKPATLTFEEAAGLLLVGRDRLAPVDEDEVGTGDTVLIHGASGGVGLMAVQLAVARGAKVIATASPARHEQLRELRCRARRVRPRTGRSGTARSAQSTRRWTWWAPTRRWTPRSNWSADRDRIATIAGFGRAGELGIAALTGADGGQEIRDASRAPS